MPESTTVSRLDDRAPIVLTPLRAAESRGSVRIDRSVYRRRTAPDEAPSSLPGRTQVDRQMVAQRTRLNLSARGGQLDIGCRKVADLRPPW
jgi:hypothetical protein